MRGRSGLHAHSYRTSWHIIRHDVRPACRPVLAAWEYRAIKFIAAPCLERVGTDKDKLRQCLAGWKGKMFGVPG